MAVFRPFRRDTPAQKLWAKKGTLGWVCFRLWGCLGRRKDERSRNRERGRAQALGGRRFLNSYNNQPKDGVRGRGVIRDGMRPRRNVPGGGRFGIVWGGESVEEKNKYLNPSWP